MHDEAPGEWKKIASQAAACGVFGLTALACGHFLPAPHAWSWLSTAWLALACLAGGWDAAVDAWAALRARRIDVHLLMLIAAGGAPAVAPLFTSRRSPSAAASVPRGRAWPAAG